MTPLVDAFFVMEYSPNFCASASASSPLTSGLFSDQTTVNEYASVVPPSKVILGLPYFGIDWPTSNGTLTGHGHRAGHRRLPRSDPDQRASPSIGIP